MISRLLHPGSVSCVLCAGLVPGVQSSWFLAFSCELMACVPHLGSLPTQWGTAGAFDTLRSLDLSSNKLTGSLPSTWGASGVLTNLNQLDVSSNELSGTIPSSWGASGSLGAIGQL